MTSLHDTPRNDPFWIRHGGPLLALASFTLYTLLQQESGYGDATGAILDIEAGLTFGQPIHFLYMPIVAGLSVVLSWADLTLFQVGCLASSLGTAIGVGILYAAARRITSDPWDAPLVAGLAATCPAVVFFGSTMEVHGLFFGGAALAMYVMTRLVSDHRWQWSVALGLSTAFASLLHASGHLLPGTAGLAYLALTPHIGIRRRLQQCVVIGSTHLVATVLAATVLRTLTNTPESTENAIDFVLRYSGGRGFKFEQLPKTLWYKLVWPYLAMSVTWIWALRHGANRPLVWALLVAWLVHFAMCMVLVPGYNEHGAYQTPLAWLLALIAVRTLARPLLVGMIVLGAALAVLQIRQHDDPEPARRFASGVRAATEGPLCLVIGGSLVECQAAALILREVEVFNLAKIAGGSEAAVRQFITIFDSEVQARIARGQQVVLSAAAYDLLAMPVVQAVGGASLLKTHLDTHYRLDPVAAPGFRGWRVYRR